MTHATPAPDFHQLIWIDHKQARLYAVTHHDIKELVTIHAPEQGRGHVHHHAGTMGSGHAAIPPTYLAEIVAAVRDAGEVLIVGPAYAKHALKRYIAERVPLLDRRIVGVEPMDKCGHADLQAFASLFFRQADRMRPA